MSDTISVRGLAVEACHGVLPEEKTQPQPFVLDIDLSVDLSWAGTSDALADTVSYAEIARRAADVVASPPVDLIESLAERVAAHCLAESALVEAVVVTVHKPQAPIGLPFADVAVTRRVERAATAVVGLGANLSDPVARLADAVRRIAALDGVEAATLSPLVVTDPVGGPPDQPRYLNAVLLARTRLAPRTLLRRLQEIEAVHGRTREVRWGPRTLDLDLISYVDPLQGGEVRCATAELTLPHPRAAERAFVQVPWSLADPTRPTTPTGSTVPATLTTPTTGTGDGVRSGPDWPAHVAGTTMVRSW